MWCATGQQPKIPKQSKRRERPQLELGGGGLAVDPILITLLFIYLYNTINK